MSVGNVLLLIQRRIFILAPAVLKKVTRKPLFIGLFTLSKWVGHSRFYAFKCPECGLVTVDYPHGYTFGGRLYFLCGCNGENDRKTVIPIHDPVIYKAEGLEASKDISLVRNIQSRLSASPVSQALLIIGSIAALLFYMTHC